MTDTLPPIEFAVATVKARPVEMPAGIEKQKQLFEATLRAVGHDTKDGLTALEGLSASLAEYRRWVGLRKIPGVAALARRSLRPDGQMVIFTIHHEVVSTLLTLLKPYAPLAVYRDSTPYRRDRAVERFRQIEKHRVLICSIKAAAIPLDLTVAHRIVFAEAEWLPRLNAQAVLRVYRRGQTQPVNVRFVGLERSGDEKVNRTLMQKTRRLIENFHD